MPSSCSGYGRPARWSSARRTCPSGPTSGPSPRPAGGVRAAGRPTTRTYWTATPGRRRRFGVWRAAPKGQPAATAVLDATIATLRARGAVVVDDVVLPGLADSDDNELPALLVEFKHDVNAYLAARPGRHPADLAGLIAFNQAHADVEMPV